MIKESYLIKYSLFCSRKKFNLKKFLKDKLTKKEKFDFEDFRKYLTEKMVCPPTEDFFNLVKLEIEKELIEKEVQAKIEKEHLKEKFKEQVKEQTSKKPVRSRRRKKK